MIFGKRGECLLREDGKREIHPAKTAGRRRVGVWLSGKTKSPRGSGGVFENNEN
jgi:hypothetical protein